MYFIIAGLIAGLLIYFLKPAVSVPDNLGSYFDFSGEYYKYVYLVNKSASNDTSSFRAFLEKRNFYDADVNAHGWVIVQLIKKNGDKVSSTVLQRIDSNQREYLKDYIGLGIEHFDKSPMDTFIKQFPQTCEMLHLESDGNGNYF